MVEFNEARFQEEREAIGSRSSNRVASRHAARRGGPSALVVKTLPRRRCHKGLDNWRGEAGDRVVWAWKAFTLDGKRLTAGKDEFEVERGAVPQAFHEAAKQMGHLERADVWTPSISAFGVRGIPGEIPPYMPLRLRIEQSRSIQDTAWWAAIQRAETPRSPWLAAFLRTSQLIPWPNKSQKGCGLQVHSSRREFWTEDQMLSLRIRTSACIGDFERETQMEWRPGTQDQLVPALEHAVLHHAAERPHRSVSGACLSDRKVPPGPASLHAPLCDSTSKSSLCEMQTLKSNFC